MKNDVLLPITTNSRELLPNYEDYATVNRHVFHRLNERRTQDWKIIHAEELIAHAESVIDELMKKGLLRYESLGHVYGVRPTGKVERSDSGNGFKLRVSETIENQLIYFCLISMSPLLNCCTSSEMAPLGRSTRLFSPLLLKK